MNLTDSVIYDIETFPNCFTLSMECLTSDQSSTWEISEFRDDRRQLFEWLNWLRQIQAPMIGFNNLHFDYPILHFIYMNPHVTVQQIYEKAMSIINGEDRFAHTIWTDDRITPQIDLFKINHFDNPAKSTSLKALQINMRSESVVDMPVEVGTELHPHQISTLIDYNIHDVKETKKFAHLNRAAIDYRLSLVSQFGVDVLNWPDTKIGSRMMEAKLGVEVCYDYSTGRKQPRQTLRDRIALKDIIFSYVQFTNPEFNRVLDFIKRQVVTKNEMTDMLTTKGAFNVTANVGDVEFHFGTGGLHGSVKNTKFESQGNWVIRDIDVASLYPSIAIVNGLAPEHLGQHFVNVYAELPKERKKWQAEKGKKCVEANTLKLASNGVYGNSNNKFSVFFDPKFTLTITINGQLMLCMLLERLVTVPTLKLIQANTDGISYYIDARYDHIAADMCKEWEKLTALTLEYANYKRMWIRDVNNYVAEGSDGELKLKGAYWSPDPLDYHNSISNAQPPAWHKDLSAIVSTRAAVCAMVHGLDPEMFIKMCTNSFDFMCRAKVKRNDKLLYGGDEIQRTSRYYVSTDGKPLIKQSPPAGVLGMYKRASGVSQVEYAAIMIDINSPWDGRVCTKNKKRYENRSEELQAGYNVTICNNAQDFDFSNINYDWYIKEANKLIIV